MWAVSRLLLLITIWFADPSPPLYDGRPLHEWQNVIGRIDPQDPASRVYVPGLVELMHDTKVPWTTRRRAALTLGRLGPLARDAIPDVLQHLNEVHPADPETSPQHWVLSSLALYGREAHYVAPHIVQLLNQPQSSVITRLGCLEVLSQMGSAAPEAIPALTHELERHLPQTTVPAELELAIGAAEALGMIGPEAQSAVPVLMRAAQSSEDHVRRESIRALGKIGVAARDAQPVILDAMLMDESVIIRDVATVSLGQLGDTGWPWVEPLFTAEEAEIRERALQVVSRWKSAQAHILPVIHPLLYDANAAVRLAACRSLSDLTQQHDSIWPVLVDLLTDSEREIRRGSSKLIQEIGQSPGFHESRMEQLLHDPRPAVRNEGLRLQRNRAK